MHGGGTAGVVEGIKTEVDWLMYDEVGSHAGTTMKFESICANSFSGKPGDQLCAIVVDRHAGQ